MASPAPRPNLLLIMTDQQRGDALGIDGHPDLLTPHLDALAAGGTRFRRAYSECPSCIAARRTLLTGLKPHRHGMVGYEEGHPLEPWPTLPDLLRRAGYQTASIGRDMHTYPEHRRYGFETLWHAPFSDVYSEFHREIRFLSTRKSFHGWPHYLDHGMGPNAWTARPWPFDERFHQTNWAVNKAIQYLDERDPSAPYFISLGFVAPHPPLVPPQFYYDRYHARALRPPALGSWASLPGPGQDVSSARVNLAGESLQACLAGYYGLINHVDDQVGLLLQRLSMEKDPPVILFTSDHGEMLGDHGLFRKCMGYEGSARIPLLLSGPGIERGAVSDAPVALQDVLPTFLALAGVEVPRGVDGGDLRTAGSGIPGGSRPWRECLHGEHAATYADVSGMHYLTDGRWKYLWHSADGREQFFDLAADPRELTDLAGLESHRAALAAWRGRLAEELAGRPEGFVSSGALVPGRPHAPLVPTASR
ncbi:MAG: sulfatase-like hydrolase/transferase [Spirochaetes bacterium]|nr:sulfatase-like hydrolase/transferase [Spirochaetota bacterium]